MTSANPALSKIRIVCISDTHNHGPGEGFKLPPGDVLVHAGDLTKQGKYPELQKAAEWLAKTDFAVKIVIAGTQPQLPQCLLRLQLIDTVIQAIMTAH